MNDLKESILNDAKKGSRDTTNTSNETTNTSNETTSHTTNASNETTGLATTTTTRSNDTYVHGVGMLTVLAIGVCVFFPYNTFPKNKKQANEKQNQPPKRRHML